MLHFHNMTISQCHIFSISHFNIIAFFTASQYNRVAISQFHILQFLRWRESCFGKHFGVGEQLLVVLHHFLRLPQLRRPLRLDWNDDFPTLCGGQPSTAIFDKNSSKMLFNLKTRIRQRLLFFWILKFGIFFSWGT